MFCLLVWLGPASAAAAGTLDGTMPLPVLAGLSPEEQGLAIFREKDRRESGYQDLTVEVEMVLRDRRGTEARRELSLSQLEMAGEGDRLLVVFETPKPIRGTALLSYSHKAAPDDQWLYLPAQRRVKKIASRNKSGPFLSSEFAYEDLALQEVEKFSYTFLGREACGERCCPCPTPPGPQRKTNGRVEPKVEDEALHRLHSEGIIEVSDKPVVKDITGEFISPVNQFVRLAKWRLISTTPASSSGR